MRSSPAPSPTSQRSDRTDGQPGASTSRRSTVDRVYQGKIDTETRQVQTDRHPAPPCSLAGLVAGAEYVFFVRPAAATPGSPRGTQRHPARPTTTVRRAGRAACSATGSRRSPPAPEQATFTPVDTGDAAVAVPRLAAPGVALVLVGLLGLLLVVARRRRRRSPAGRSPGPRGTSRRSRPGSGLAGCPVAGPCCRRLRRPGTRRRQAAAHLLELRPGGHLLGVDRGLDAVEEPLEPADQLGLGDPQLGVGRGRVLGERQRQPLQLLDQLGREPGLELLDRGLVDLLEPDPAGLVERRRPAPPRAAAGSCCRSASPWPAARPGR